jgi:hypothetical protein
MEKTINMKKLILIIITLFPLFCLSQSGGIDKLKIVHRDLRNNGNNILIRIDNEGVEHPLKIDEETLKIENDSLKGSYQFVLDTASTTILGGVKIDGTSITISPEGIISAPSTGGGTVVAVTGIAPITSTGGNSPAIEYYVFYVKTLYETIHSQKSVRAILW